MEEIPLALLPPNPLIRIRPVWLSDAEALHTRCWSSRRLVDVQRIVTRAQRIGQQQYGLGAVAVVQGQVAGYGQFTLWSRCGEISDLVVCEPCRGQGIGTAIIQYLLRASRDMQAECVEIGATLDNPRAIALYRRLGFADERTLMLDVDGADAAVLYLRIAL